MNVPPDSCPTCGAARIALHARIAALEEDVLEGMSAGVSAFADQVLGWMDDAGVPPARKSNHGSIEDVMERIRMYRGEYSRGHADGYAEATADAVAWLRSLAEGRGLPSVKAALNITAVSLEAGEHKSAAKEDRDG